MIEIKCVIFLYYFPKYLHFNIVNNMRKLENIISLFFFNR